MKRVSLLIMLLIITLGAIAQNCWIKMANTYSASMITIGGKHIAISGSRLICINSLGDIEWSQNIDLFNIIKIDSTTDGNIIVAGQRIIGNAPANQYPTTIHVAALIKIGLDGKLVWEKNFPPNNYPLSSAETVTQTATGGFVFGLTQYSNQTGGIYELIETDAQANIINRKAIDLDYQYQITRSANGYLLNNKAEIISLNTQFDTLWVYDKGYFGLTTISSVTGISPSGAIVNGNKTLKIDANGNVLWTKNSASSGVYQVPDGFLFCEAIKDTSISPLWFSKISKVNEQGSLQWNFYILLSKSIIANHVYQTPAKELFIADAERLVLIKTDSTGACLNQPIDTITFTNQFNTSVNLLRGNLINDGLTLYKESIADYPQDEGIMYPANTPNPKNTMFASALWMAGLDAGGNLHAAAQTYRQSGVDYLPYPISAQPQERYGWDHVWRITNQEVYAFRQDFNDNGQLNNAIPDAIEYWPAKYNTNARGANGTPINVNFDAAPFYDNNADGIYNVFDGDYPLVYGDEMFWWMFTDSMPVAHGETEGAALGVEVNAMAYSFYGTPGDVLERTIFTRYEITNKSSNYYHDFFLGIFSDIEIGCYNDDYIGCDTIGEFYYGYNATDHDSCVTNTGQLFGFITNPPLQSVVFLSHTLDRFSLGFSSFSNIPNSVKYNYILQNKDENGSHIVNPITGNEEYHMFPGNPSEATEWSMASTNVPPHDSKGIGSSGPFTLQPYETITFEVAYVVHPKGDLTNSSNVTEMQAEVDELHQFHDGYHPVSIAEVQQKEWSFNIYPNPNSGSFSINIEGMATYKVYDLAGRKVEATIIGQANGANISGLNAGTYIVQVTKAGQHKNQKVVVF